MKRNELVVLIFIIGVLMAINVLNFVRRERARQSHVLIIEEGRVELSLNSTSAAELRDLPGIGPVLADRIVRYRDQKGGFTSLEELKDVKGVGDKIYQKISPYLKLQYSE